MGTLADEIFGRDNRLGIVTVVHNAQGRNQEKFFGTSNEFMLVYAKNKNDANFNKIALDKKKRDEFNIILIKILIMILVNKLIIRFEHPWTCKRVGMKNE